MTCFSLAQHPFPSHLPRVHPPAETTSRQLDCKGWQPLQHRASDAPPHTRVSRCAFVTAPLCLHTSVGLLPQQATEFQHLDLTVGFVFQSRDFSSTLKTGERYGILRGVWNVLVTLGAAESLFISNEGLAFSEGATRALLCKSKAVLLSHSYFFRLPSTAGQ